MVGGKEERKQGRSYNTNKTKAMVGVELNAAHKIKRVYTRPIDDYSCKSLTPFFEQHIGSDAEVITDKWSGYSPLKKDYNIKQVRSKPEKNFKEVHLIIHQIKSWLRTVPTHVSKQHIKSYFDEFSFRINRSQSKENIFHRAIQKMVGHKPLFCKQISQ